MSRQPSDEFRVQELAEQVLSSESTPEEVCRECPELLPHVLRRLALVRRLNADLDVLLPRRAAEHHAVSHELAVAALPSIPGYEVKALLGRGGMGIVYRARHLRLDRDVALKMLLSGEFASPHELERFFLEARAIARLSHPNIVQVHDVSERDGRPYFTMELVEGGTLAHWLGATPQKAEKAAELVRCLAGAVEFAHGNGIVHRDLKPANVLLTADGIPKVTDFGLARRMSGEDATLSGRIVGTPSYMAPEQIRGAPVEASADVYALGAILYEILTGRPPFRSDSALATQMQVLSKDPVRPALLNGRVPRDLETICLRCLHKDPARRYASAADLASDLQRFLAHEPIRARPVGRMERALLWSRRNPAKATALSFSVLLFGYAVDGVVESRALARQKRDQEAVLSPQLDDVFEQLRGGNLARARSLLAQMPETVSEELRERVGRARRELFFAEQLDAIRLGRVDITEGRFDRSANRGAADLAYDRAFREAGFGIVGDDPAVVAARVRDAAVRPALVGALDDWAFCAGEEAREAWLLEVARRSDPHPSDWRERLRDPALRLDAETLAELDLDVRANRTTVQLLLGAAERMREADADVIPLLELVQRAHPEDFWANFALGDVLHKQDPREAIRFAQAAVALRPRVSIAHQGLGTALRGAGRLDDALEEYRQAVLVEPGYAEAHGRLGVALQLANELDDAIPAYREAIRINPDLAWAHLNLGHTLNAKGRVDEALDEMREAARLEPSSGMAQVSLGNCLESLGRNREALEAFRRAVEVEPLPGNHHELGSCLARLGDFEEAEAQFRRTIELEPAHASARTALRTLLVQMGRGEEALASWRTAIQERAADSLAWDGFPELCAYLGREDDYHRACEELLERFGDTDEPRACERIGRACLLLPSPSTLPGAVALIDRALASPLGPDWTRPFIEVARALAEVRSGRFESAIEILSGDAGQALKPLPDLIRALALQRAGAEADARQYLGMAALSFDWSPAAAGTHDSWIAHVIRREAEALILPELADLLAGRQQPRDDDTRAALIGARVSTQHDAAAARLYESLRDEISTTRDRDQRFLAARTLARAGAGLGLDPADDPERARFRERVRDWLRLDLASFSDPVESGGPDGRATALAILHSWRDDPAFAALRDARAIERLPPDEGDDCRALWLQVEALLQADR